MDDGQQHLQALRRRILADPASVFFVGLSEEYRRRGLLREAIEIAQAGLLHHPTYTAGRLSLARALAENGEAQSARRELGRVLSYAPDNLAALRLIAAICAREGAIDEARTYYRTLSRLAPADTEARAALDALGASRPAGGTDPSLPRQATSDLGASVAEVERRGSGPDRPPPATTSAATLSGGDPTSDAPPRRSQPFDPSDPDDWDYDALDRFVRSNEVNRRL